MHAAQRVTSCRANVLVCQFLHRRARPPLGRASCCCISPFSSTTAIAQIKSRRPGLRWKATAQPVTTQWRLCQPSERSAGVRARSNTAQQASALERPVHPLSSQFTGFLNGTRSMGGRRRRVTQPAKGALVYPPKPNRTKPAANQRLRLPESWTAGSQARPAG